MPTDDKNLAAYTDEQLAALPHAELFMARNKPGADQQRLGPAEHRAFAREAVEENPAMALVLGLAIPAYTAAKILARMEQGSLLRTAAQSVAGKSRSEPSMKEITESYKGIKEGLSNKAASVNERVKQRVSLARKHLLENPMP